MQKSIDFQNKINNVIVYFLCFTALLLFFVFNFEIILIFYKIIELGGPFLLLKYINFTNILNLINFFFFITLISFALFITSGLLAIVIFMFKLDKIYQVFYAFNNVNNILFAPTFIFLVHTYNITKYGLFFILIFDTIADMTVLIYEFFNIEFKNKLLIIKQFHKNATPIFSYLLYTFFYRFKHIIAIYFTEIIDNLYMYAFIIQTPLFLNIVESITQQTNICNEFILGYFLVQIITYFLFTVFYIFF